MSYSNGRSNAYGYDQPRDGRYERQRPAETAPYVHPSRQQAVPASVDLSAPIIHFGTSREVAPRQSMKDQHFVRAQDDKNQSFLTAATKEQKLHTLFVGNLENDLDDYWIERLLKAAAKLRQWKRATDGAGKSCNFGFAEYDDPENVDRAYKLLRDITVPSTRGEASRHLLIAQDETSKAYVEDTLALKAGKNNDTKERNVMLSASGQIEKVLKDFSNPDFKRQDEQESKGKNIKKATTTVDDAQAVTIMLSIEDELGDIPEEQRESIAKEITSFRERSAKRDQDRARQIAEEEARRLEFERASRQDPRKQHGRGEDAGEVAMIRRTRKTKVPYEEENMTEEEIAQRREKIQNRDAEARYIDEERRWHNKESTRVAAYKREVERREQEMSRQVEDARNMAERLAHFDDDTEVSRVNEEFYRDRSAWARARNLVRAREIEMDKKDRLEEQREVEAQVRSSATRADTETDAEEQMRSGEAEESGMPLRLSLARKAAEDTRKSANAEKTILEDAEDESVGKRVLIPLQYEDDAGDPADEQASRQARLRALVDAIPTTRDELWKLTVDWVKLDDVMLGKIRDFVAKKVVEAIGMEEEDLIAFITDKISSHGRPEEIVQELGAAIGDEEESELLTIKIWRYLLILLASASA